MTRSADGPTGQTAVMRARSVSLAWRASWHASRASDSGGSGGLDSHAAVAGLGREPGIQTIGRAHPFE